MMSDRFDALGRNATAVQHALEERADVVRALRPSEGDQENRIEQDRTLTYDAAACQRGNFIASLQLRGVSWLKC